tara:strand:- start:860 stop:2773 length:1914 start_codon:yes stop_codon:yes gene_type:complete
MGFQISPGVNVSEIDLTTVVPAVSTTEAAIAAEFRWGPMDERTLVTSEDNLVTKFWKPDNNVADAWFTASNFLAYGNKLWVVRVAPANSLNATSEATTGSNTTGTGLQVKNDLHWEESYDTGSGNVGPWIAKYPGALGNSLKVSVCPSSNAFSSTLTGNLAVSVSSNTVTGTGTTFTAELNPGDILVLNGEQVKVSTITNSTSLTVRTNHVAGASANASVERRWEYYNFVNVAPGTGDTATQFGGTNDEIHVVVVDEDGEFTGVVDTVLEVYDAVSMATDAKLEDGSTNYYKNVIAQKSNYIRWMDHPTSLSNLLSGDAIATATFGTDGKNETHSLAAGARGAAPSAGNLQTGYDFFKDTEDVDVSFLLGASVTSATAIHMINLIAESRKDCIVCLSPERADVVNNSGSEHTDSITFRDTLPSSSYAVLDSGWKYMLDKYNDVFRFVPLNGDTAGLMVQTDIARDPWWSPAGYNRGNVKSAVKLAYNPIKAERDLLYKNGINPVVQFPGQGTVLFGDKTLLAKPSAFDRINVRRLFIVLEKAIATAAKFTLFEFNDEFTRAQFKNLVEPFLRDVQGRRGIIDFRVVCDESNNTAEVIDRNEFIGDIYVKPSRSINYIQLNFVAVRTGVEFSEIVGRF